MKKLTLLSVNLFIAIILFGQANILDTSFFSNALQETKMVDVFLPPGYDENPDWNYPVIYYLHGWGGDQNTGSNDVMATAHSFIVQETIEPVIIVSADNSPGPFGGSWYVNSILWGNYEDFMMNDLVSWIDNTFRTIPEKDGRALMGQSMGCFGSFRYGILYKEMFKVIAGHTGPMIYDVDLWLESASQQVLAENQPGPPYSYAYATGGSFTQGSFLLSGALSPNLNSTQTYINPQNVDFIFDENGEFIDSVVTKWQANDMSLLVKQLTPENNVGIYYGCGTNDEWLLYPALSAFADTLEMLGLPFEFYSHNGGHSMPYAFKTGALIFIDSLLMSPGIYSTSCLPEGITFTTQEEIDNFQVNHPYCTEIEGDLIISGADIINLNGLNVMTSVGGDLNILDNYALTNLTGLENLTSIIGNLKIGSEYEYNGNFSLTSLSGLDNLTTIGDSLKIGYNDALTGLSGLENLVSIGGGLIVEKSNALISMTGLGNLVSVGGNCIIAANQTLTSLSGLDNLDVIGGNLWF
ncbi:MAG: hypothetical protein K8R74_05245, partial [Bacteroidales bacterium]|nr:hypothetical protein [Bacteroidales bacterium]